MEREMGDSRITRRARRRTSSTQPRPRDRSSSPVSGRRQSARGREMRRSHARKPRPTPENLGPGSLDTSSPPTSATTSTLREGLSSPEPIGNKLEPEPDPLDVSTSPLSQEEGKPVSSKKYNIQEMEPGVFVTSEEEKQKWRERRLNRTLAHERGEVPERQLPMSDEEEFNKFYSSIQQRMRDIDLAELGKIGPLDAGKNSVWNAGKHALGAAAGMFILATIGVPGLVAAKGTAAGAAAHAAAHGAASGLFSHGNPFKDPDFKINLLLILCFYLLKDNMMNDVNSVSGKPAKKDMLETKIRDIYKFLHDAYKNEKIKGDDFHANFVENISKEIFGTIKERTHERPEQKGRGGNKNRKKKTKKKTKKKNLKYQLYNERVLHVLIS